MAQDALAGIDFLKDRKNLTLKKIGLIGIWQGGWVNAKAIEQSSDKIDFVINISAPGSSITLRERDNNSIEASMKCRGNYTETQIANVLKQRNHFFDFIKNPTLANKLDDYTKSIEKDALLKELLLPESDKVDLKNRNQWYTALELNYDPSPTWKNFNKPVFMQFNEFDNYPLSSEIKAKVDSLKNKNIHTVMHLNAQHGGFETADKCNDSFYGLTKYHKDYFSKIKIWLKTF